MLDLHVLELLSRDNDSLYDYTITKHGEDNKKKKKGRKWKRFWIVTHRYLESTSRGDRFRWKTKIDQALALISPPTISTSSSRIYSWTNESNWNFYNG